MDTNNLRQIYRKDPPIINSFDFTDVISGNSYVTLYGGYVNVSDQLIESYTTGEDGNTITIDGNNMVAQTFTVGNTGEDIDFYPTRIIVKTTAQSNDGVDCKITDTSVGEPSTTLYEFVNVTLKNTSDDGTNYYQQLEINQATNVKTQKLSSTTQYAFIIGTKSLGTSYLREDSTSSTYTGGALLESADSGVNWTEQSGEDLIFWVYGSDINPYQLSTQQFTTLSGSTNIVPGVVADELTEIGNLDFSTESNMQGTVNGKAFIELTVSQTLDDIELDISIIRNRNGTETTMGTVTTFNNPTTISAVIKIENIQIIPKDEIILRITPKYSDASGTTDSVTINHDPNGTQLILRLPFKTEI